MEVQPNLMGFKTGCFFAKHLKTIQLLVQNTVCIAEKLPDLKVQVAGEPGTGSRRVQHEGNHVPPPSLGIHPICCGPSGCITEQAQLYQTRQFQDHYTL